jgi:hypothetical protein
MWGSKQYISLFRGSDDSDEVCVPIKSDEQSLEWFYQNLENGVVHIDAQINDFDGPLQFSPTKRRLHPTVRERVREKVLEPASTPSLDLVSFVNPTQVTQETSHKESKRELQQKKGKKPKRKPYNEEAIRVDEEGMYSDTDSLIALSDSNYDTDMAASPDSDLEYDPDDEILDDDDDEIIPFSYDVDDPCIDVGRVFTDVKQCKEAVIQHAILNDHAIRPIKTDKDRFRAVCLRADKGCKWKFFASTSKRKYSGCKGKICILHL